MRVQFHKRSVEIVCALDQRGARFIGQFQIVLLPVDRRCQRHHGGAESGYFGDDGDFGVIAVGRSAGADRQHQSSASSWALIKRYGVFGVNILTSDQIEIAEQFTGKGGLKGAERFAGAEWTTAASGVPLLVGGLAAIDCEVEDIIERHSHAIVIGHVRDLQLSPRMAALAYWQGQYVAIDRDEDAVRLAEVSVPRTHSKAET